MNSAIADEADILPQGAVGQFEVRLVVEPECIIKPIQIGKVGRKFGKLSLWKLFRLRRGIIEHVVELGCR